MPSINGSSTADISFIMLLFFLLTTSMGSDKGIARQLPPAPTEDQQDVMIDVNRRNMLRVLVNSNGQILANGEVMTIDQLKQKTAYEMLRSLVGSEMCIRDSEMCTGYRNCAWGVG